LDTQQVLRALMALKEGDFRVHLPVDWTGLPGKIADTFNEVADMMCRFTEELGHVSRVVGREGPVLFEGQVKAVMELSSFERFSPIHQAFLDQLVESIGVAALRFQDLQDYVERTFRHIAEAKGLEFRIELDEGLPASIFTDLQRLEQVIRNLLSNAFKFTEQGQVLLRVAQVTEGWDRDRETLVGPLPDPGPTHCPQPPPTVHRPP